ncbi:MAG: hypothetical protein IJA15_00215 [Clostridia bacterium]|nr:hypothetical protein [Clostridia bacterium]
MKKLLSILVFVLTLSFLSSCGTVEKNITFSGESWQTLSVEIYYLEEAYLTQSEARNIREENTPIYILDALNNGEKINDLMNEISSLTFTKEVMYFPAAVDWVYAFEEYVICVVYPNGYDIIASNGQLYYSIDKKGKEDYTCGHSDYSGETAWSDIIEKYIPND